MHISKKNIIIFLLAIALLSCDRLGYRANNSRDQYYDRNEYYSEPREEKRVTYIRTGAINVANHLNIRDAPGLHGKVLRQSFFGDHFNIYETIGSRRMENRVMDLWYKISETDEEWVNALYLRKLPFTIASGKKYNYGEYGTKGEHLSITIHGIRYIDENILFNVSVWEDFLGRTVLEPYDEPFTQGELELKENYIFRHIGEMPTPWITPIPIGTNIHVNFLNSTFQNLINYAREISEISEITEPIYGGVHYYHLEFGYEHIVLSSDEFLLTGVRIGNTKEDVITQFGEDYVYDQHYNTITYYGIYGPSRLHFWLSDDKVIEIELLLSLEK